MNPNTPMTKTQLQAKMADMLLAHLSLANEVMPTGKTTSQYPDKHGKPADADSRPEACSKRPAIGKRMRDVRNAASSGSSKGEEGVQSGWISPMKTGLRGWELIEGRIDMAITRNPKVSEIIAALEAIRHDQIDPFVILVVPASGDNERNFCQARVYEDGYVCEIRIFSGKEFCHMRTFMPDAEGRIGDDAVSGERYGEDPGLGLTIRIFTDFIADPTAFPSVDGLRWWDISGQFEPVE